MTTLITRRNIVASLIAAPAILKLGLWMPVRSSKVSYLQSLIDEYGIVPLPAQEPEFSFISPPGVWPIRFKVLWVDPGGSERMAIAEPATEQQYIVKSVTYSPGPEVTLT